MAATSVFPANPHYWAVVPAAGFGRRMESAIPKQYLLLHGRPVLAYTLERLAQHPNITGIVVAIAHDDPHWQVMPAMQFRVPVHTVTGGKERSHSVLNALNYLSQQTHADDWVLVHDAARPCVRVSDIDRLITQLQEDAVGGILAMPVRDTMKRTDSTQHVTATIERADLWHALTPQMFRLTMLRDAITAALAQGVQVTDEAMAIELTGRQPRLVEGAADNIKITRQEDLQLAELYLLQQQKNIS